MPGPADSGGRGGGFAGRYRAGGIVLRLLALFAFTLAEAFVELGLVFFLLTQPGTGASAAAGEAGQAQRAGGGQGEQGEAAAGELAG